MLSIRSLYILLVVLLSAWVLGAALRLSTGLAGGGVRGAMAALSLGFLCGTGILVVAEAQDRPGAGSINTGMTGEGYGLISDLGVMLDKVHESLVMLCRD